MTARNVDALFSPRSIALIGASDQPGSVGHVLAANLLAGRFGGEVMFVNPHGRPVLGRKVHRELAALPTSPDLAVIATPAPTVAGLVRELGGLGCRAAVVISAGFEGDDQASVAARQALLDASRPHLLRIVGPNCLGVLSPLEGVNASFARSAPPAGGLALVAQSGAVAAAALDWAPEQGLGFSRVVTLGDSLDVDVGDLVDHLGRDAATEVILLYVESLRDARKFMSAARFAARAKPVIVLKAGRSEAGAHAAFSHTRALAGADAVYSAAFRRAGVLQVDTLEELLGAAAVFSAAKGRRPASLAILTNGGGAGVLAVDALARAGGALTSLSEKTRDALRATGPEKGAFGDPVDILGDARPERYETSLSTLLAAPEVEAVLAINCPTAVADSGEAAQAVVRAARAAAPRKLVLSAWLGAAGVRQGRALLAKATIPGFASAEAAAQTFVRLGEAARLQDGLLEAPDPLDGAGQTEEARAVVASALQAGRTALDPLEAQALLAAYGVPFVETRRAGSPDEAAAQAAAIGGPIALKIQSPDISHKTDVGGVRLGLVGPEAVRAAASEMIERIAALKPDARLDGFIVQAMATPGESHELLAGVVRDPTFGPVVRPQAIALPAAKGPIFREAMHELIVDLKAAIPAAFEAERYQTQRSTLEEGFQRQQNEAIEALQQKGAEKNVALLRTPVGFTLLPSRNNEIVQPEQFTTWPAAERQAWEEGAKSLQEDIDRFLRHLPRLEKAHRDAVHALNRQTAEGAVGHLIEALIAQFADDQVLSAHLARVRADLLDSIEMLIGGDSEAGAGMAQDAPFARYEVNVLVSQPANGAMPIIEEPHPTLANLTGSIEHVNHQGALVTNFRLIKAGALHRANGGYLLVDARSLLSEPFAWPALKRILRSRKIAIEDMSKLVGFSTTVSLEPDPIPLDLKVVLYGPRALYFLLSDLDPELGEHFKILADFDDDLDRSPENEALLARLIAGLVRREGLLPLNREAVIAMLEHAARRAENSAKLTLLVDQLRDVLTEADFCAKRSSAAVIERAHVEQSIDHGARRSARLRDRMQDSVLKDVMLIRTSGEKIGQINGLSVIELGGFAFGRPSRISCRTRPGSGRLVDIEREVELGGPIHSKGVLILSGFLGGRYAVDAPMSLQASLVFEQSYSGVEGDSASSAELYALLSALAESPLRQDLAVTGSVNQHGEVQAIGGVNAKIEGFFDLCEARGLTGSQGVVIPKSNVQHLMLRKDVVEACAAGRFAIHAVADIDQGIELLTGRPAGARGADGLYPTESVNRRVEDRLREFARIRRAFSESDLGPDGKRSDLRLAAKSTS